MKREPRYEVHEHTIVRGQRAYRPDASRFDHAHEGGEEPHRHPDVGPATYGRRTKTLRTRPVGLQLPLEELADWQRSFRVVFVDRYTAEHERAGIARERFAAERACFQSLAAGDAALAFGAAERMVSTFRMRPIYEVRGGGTEEPAPAGTAPELGGHQP